MQINSKNRTAVNYPPDALLTTEGVDIINSQDVHTLDELFRERVRRSCDEAAYSQYDTAASTWGVMTWAEVALQVERWQVAFKQSGLAKGDRVAICYRNSVEWVIFDQAALRLGLVVVPLYTADRPENIAYVIDDSGSKLVLFDNPGAWQTVAECDEPPEKTPIVLVVNGASQSGITNLTDWLPEQGAHLERGMAQPDDLASIVYTSGTTGRPKGVMLSHKNMLSNAYFGMRSVALTPQDSLLSFLPLSHTFERTIGYYAAIMSGCKVTYNRSISELPADLMLVKPTVIISVPRIFERVHNQIYNSVNNESAFKQKLFRLAVKAGWAKFQYQQGHKAWNPLILIGGVLDALVGSKIRDRFGGAMRFSVVGGAPLSLDVAKTFISMGIPLLQGFGMTESSPVVSCNTLSMCKPDSIGLPLRGVQVKLEDNDELWVQGDSVMMGYWGKPEATADVIVEDDSGRWLRSGDRAAIDDDGFISIIGRIKDILVLANGEKVPPTDIEAAIKQNSLFEQVMVLGEGKSFLSALVVLDQVLSKRLCEKHGITDPTGADKKKLDEVLLSLVTEQMDPFPGYAKIRKLHICSDPWTVESGLITPTLKIKRPKLMQYYADAVATIYSGHGVIKS